MVLSYSYLWHSEAEKGGTSGRKDRPAAIVLVRTDAGPGEMVYVVQITHPEPAQGDSTKIPIQQARKERLGLDEHKSWVDVTEYNIFVWPGYDLKPTKTRRGGPSSRNETCLYGFLPGKVFDKINHELNTYRPSPQPILLSRTLHVLPT